MNHHRKAVSIFQLINRKKFNALVKKWDMDKGVRSFTTWEMTQALLCCFAFRLSTFREVEGALGISDSTFGDALSRRSYGFFQDLCDLILVEIRAKTGDRKIKKAVRHILAIDSSDIKVHGSLFNQIGWKQKYTVGHQASAKLHVVWNVEGGWIDDFIITGGRRSDSPVSLELRLQAGKMYVFDRAYNDFNFWQKIKDHGSYFVTRLKDCRRYQDLERKVRRGKVDKSGVLHDGPFKSTSPKARDSKLKLRHIIYRDKVSGKIFHFVTSDKKATAKEIAGIYKKRWAVELLFRWMKGHLDIRYLSTKTTNAVKTQLAAAVLVQLLLQLKKLNDKFEGSLWESLRDLRTSTVRKILATCGPPDDCRWNPAPIEPLT